MRRAAIGNSDQLLTEALLNPALAKTLLMKASPANRPFIAQRLASQLGTLAAVAGTEAANNNQRQTRPAAAVAARPVQGRQFAAPSVAAPMWGSLAPGGALRRVAR